MREKDKALIAPVAGYSPHIGVLVDTLQCCRSKTVEWLQDLTIYQLDFLYDATANSIGALLLHLCALEVAVQEYSFHGIALENPEWRQKWGVAMDLGEPARREIRGHPVSYYLAELQRIRAQTLEQLRQYQDDWLWRQAPWGNRIVNHYWMWYHVYEDEINHRGEISWLKSRIPADPPQSE
jgi:hypothetical protein